VSVDLSTVRPQSVEELAAFVKLAAASGRTLRPRGGDTKSAFGNLAPEPDHVIDMGSLSAVIDYSQVDLTIAVQPGMTLKALDELLAEKRQRLVLDAPNRERATIGGLFAAGLSGPRRLKYGALKDFVIGAEVVTSAGEVAKSGGMVVKNVSGYEMARLHYGAHGAFGIVTRLNLRVQPLPEARVELQAAYRAAAPCLEAARALLTSNLDPAGVYATSGHEGSWTLHAQLEGSRASVAGQVDKVRQAVLMAAATDEVGSSDLEGASTPEFDRVIDLTGPDDTLVARLSVPASKQVEAIESLAGLDGASLLADAGSGLIYVRCPASADAVQTILAATPATTFLKLPDALKDGLDVFGPMDQGAAAVLRRVKQQFDPQGMFSAGRFALHL